MKNIVLSLAILLSAVNAHADNSPCSSATVRSTVKKAELLLTVKPLTTSSHLCYDTKTGDLLSNYECSDEDVYGNKDTKCTLWFPDTLNPAGVVIPEGTAFNVTEQANCGDPSDRTFEKQQVGDFQSSYHVSAEGTVSGQKIQMQILCENNITTENRLLHIHSVIKDQEVWKSLQNEIKAYHQL